MNKRAFLEGFFTASAVAFGGHFMWRRLQTTDSLIVAENPGPVLPQTGEAPPASFQFTPIEIEQTQPAAGIPSPVPTLAANDLQATPVGSSATTPEGIRINSLSDRQVDAYLRKIRNFDAIFASDIYLDPKYEAVLLKTTRHLANVESYMGHGNFNLMSFDEMLQAGRNFSRIGEFEKDELDFLEEIFFANPHRYGFFGKKVSLDITDAIPRKDVAKIPNSGHFLLKGESLNLYNKLVADIGDQLILTSGVRSNVKQMHLFLAKTIEANGNLSRASRSLAPPGHSFHGVGDFDIGKIGFGARNFTSDFSSTEEYRKIARLGYVDIRYPTDNLFGVRFEPWHIKLG
ncbi:MAG: M15 family metallopeptidase [Pseudomonadales bacterium]|nr:M15 family metallopeptidase [Pseudomonadales bacterium]